ncbi:MAG: ATP-binding protein [Lewinellaceae bacterium]|nr:ATP-binding protein [Phaeodactylibacter sp.]MCB9348720.1 ATP-binding protein [Lewinellaceae bacterium]
MKYPIGIQDFRELREGGYVYVDKTAQIHRILTGGKYFFLSRPRRFGKSLLLSTIKELYAGSRELFEGLWIEDQWDWGHTNPVIWIKFSAIDYQQKGLYGALTEEMERIGAALGISLKTETLKDRFKELIDQAKQKYGRKAALLIDEYDKPIIDYLDDVEKAESNRAVLKNFYSILKDSDPYLELVFITGVSAFSKVSIFSDLNNLYNISLTDLAEELLGITQEELESYFEEPLRQAAEKNKLSFEELLKKVRRWYNGYSWTGESKLYNPFSLLSFLSGKRFQNFWFETGTPTFLVKEMKQTAYYSISDTQATSHELNNFDLERLNPISVLFQTGYLTITHYEPEDLLYTLDYPNLEVKHSLEQVLLNEYLDHPTPSGLPRVITIRNALRQKDIDTVVEVINAAFAEIPPEHWTGQKEHFYHAVTHLLFSLLGTYIQSQVNTSRGRCDAVVQTEGLIYAFEFKLDKSADEALQQIREKGYLEPYADSPKEKIAVGVNFSSEERKITDWKVEALVPRSS